ncbi:MAG: S-layer homology domain-containing protein [Candidatus Peribacteraceae bacterium]|nr:S-layer homology domain-containing protein [Candidatus Peribacteraceae bacterium]
MRTRLSATLLLSLGFTMVSETAFAASGDRSFFGVEPMSAAMVYVSDRGLLVPQEDGMFHPDRALTRIDLMRAVARDVYAGENRDACFGNIAPSPRTSYSLLFTDVRRTDIFATDVCIGMFTGVLSGRPDGSFRPFASANLAESAKVITKAYGIAPLLGGREDPRVPWHETYWYALASRDAIPDTLRSRDQTLTRGDFAEILYRLRMERPAVGFRYGPTFARVDADTPTVAPKNAAIMNDSTVVRIDAAINGEGVTVRQRDHLALAKRREIRAASSASIANLRTRDGVIPDETRGSGLFPGDEKQSTAQFRHAGGGGET